MGGDSAHDGPSTGAAAADRAVVLVRYRAGVAGETARDVHVVPFCAAVDRTPVVGAVCGAMLVLDDIETVTLGEGMPCMLCVINHVAATSSAGEPLAGSPAVGAGVERAAGGACYQQWGWPVVLHRGQVRLSLDRDVSALAIPASLAGEVAGVLTQRRCAPAVLAHPYVPEHRVVLAGERYGVRLPWPHHVHQVTGVLLLPPTVTPRGPITWTQPPQPESLRLCREIDLFGALRLALNASLEPSRSASPPQAPPLD